MTAAREAAFYLSGMAGYSTASIVLMRQCKEAYEALDVAGKVVLDIGADWGTSPIYFWARGAKEIIAYETDWRKRLSLRRLAYRGLPVTVKERWNGDYPKADVLKIDCEGCEQGFDFAKLRDYQQWAVALHGRLMGLRAILEGEGGRLSHRQEGEEVWVKA